MNSFYRDLGIFDDNKLLELFKIEKKDNKKSVGSKKSASKKTTKNNVCEFTSRDFLDATSVKFFK